MSVVPLKLDEREGGGGEKIILDRDTADKGEIVNWTAVELKPNNIYRVGIFDQKRNDVVAPVEFVTYGTTQSGIYRIPEIDYGTYPFVLQILAREYLVDTVRVKVWEERARTNITVAPKTKPQPKIYTERDWFYYNEIMRWYASNLSICNNYRAALLLDYTDKEPYKIIEEFHADAVNRQGTYLLNIPPRTYILALYEKRTTWEIVSTVKIVVSYPQVPSPPSPPPPPIIPPRPPPTEEKPPEKPPTTLLGIPLWVWAIVGIGIGVGGYFLIKKR